mmetsp:Transcript_105166/g.263405  ORF Transcript_105166/g.263405 Transcript_105166/m.263405 type:complete len:334 (-) Transcript_105166:99-1100(-)
MTSCGARRQRAHPAMLPLAMLCAILVCHLPLRLVFVPLRLITFDLDDTLWPQDPVINRANAAMMAELQKASASVSSADVIAQEMRAIRQKRSELAKAQGKPPFRISYSDLRKEGIAAVLCKHADQSQASADKAAESIFEVWLAARHQAAGELLFEGAAAAIAELRSDHPEAVIGAITNSRADPFAIQELKPFFDFCVSGEDADVFPHRKPSAVIFEKAIERARAASPNWRDSKEDRWWVHIGDDLPNDVRASALAGAAAVWVTGGDRAQAAAQERPSYSTATAEEVEERIRAAAEASKLVAAEIVSVTELPALLRQWVRNTPAGTSGLTSDGE